jgi:hypothetical protein
MCSALADTPVRRATRARFPQRFGSPPVARLLRFVGASRRGTSGVVVGDEINIHLDVELVRQK